jgi:hypothetical protein
MKRTITTLTLLLTILTATANAAELELKNPSLIQSESNEITLYMCPTNNTCTEAQKEIETICKETHATLVIKPVGFQNRKAATTWMCHQLFTKPTTTALKISEEAICQNEKDCQKITDTKEIPLIIVTNRTTQTSQKYEGWNPDIKARLVISLSDAKTGLLQEF